MTRPGITLAIALLGLATSAGAGAQQPGAALSRWRYEVGGALSTPLVEDGNGVTVRPGPALTLGVDRIIRSADRRTLVLGLLASASRLGVRSSGREWSAGTAARIDLDTRIEQAAPWGLVASLGVAATHLRADDDVIPFRAGSGSLTTVSANIGLSRRIGVRFPVQAVLSADVFRVPGQAGEDPGLSPGWVGRLRLAIRHAR